MVCTLKRREELPIEQLHSAEEETDGLRWAGVSQGVPALSEPKEYNEVASERMMLRISQIARMRIMGNKDVNIANALGLTNSGLQRILRTDAYRDYETALLNGHLAKLDEKLASNRDMLRAYAKNSVPVALQGLVELARQRKDLKTALEAQRDILRIDPDKNFTIDGISKNAPIQMGGASLPAALFESIAKDADGVSLAVASKLAQLTKEKADA